MSPFIVVTPRFVGRRFRVGRGSDCPFPRNSSRGRHSGESHQDEPAAWRARHPEAATAPQILGPPELLHPRARWRKQQTSSKQKAGLEIRAGLHTGECELVDGKVAGIAVHIGARIAHEAQPGEVLVSSTVKDLVAGSGLRFRERGVAQLRGVPGEWRLFALTASLDSRQARREPLEEMPV